MRRIVEPAQMPDPFRPDQVTKVSGKMPLRPNVPRRDDQTEDQQVLPAQECAKAEAGFSIEDREQKKNRRRINDAEKTFGQASEC
jgi:hypothetical protein